MPSTLVRANKTSSTLKTIWHGKHRWLGHVVRHENFFHDTTLCLTKKHCHPLLYCCQTVDNSNKNYQVGALENVVFLLKTFAHTMHIPCKQLFNIKSKHSRDHVILDLFPVNSVLQIPPRRIISWM